MAELAGSMVSLRIFGADLIPGDVTTLLGCGPTSSFRMGDVEIGKMTGQKWTKKTGSWLLDAAHAAPADLDRQIQSIFGKVTSDLLIWADLVQRFDVDMFLGLFMNGRDEGVGLSAETIRLLAERNIRLGVCLYGPTGD